MQHPSIAGATSPYLFDCLKFETYVHLCSLFLRRNECDTIQDCMPPTKGTLQTRQILQPATKSDAPTSPHITPAKKNDVPTSPYNSRHENWGSNSPQFTGKKKQRFRWLHGSSQLQISPKTSINIAPATKGKRRKLTQHRTSRKLFQKNRWMHMEKTFFLMFAPRATNTRLRREGESSNECWLIHIKQPWVARKTQVLLGSVWNHAQSHNKG